MKKRVRKERSKKPVKGIVRNSKKERGKKARFYDIVLELVLLLFLASLASRIYSNVVGSTIIALCLTLFAISILVFTLGILHHSIQKRAWFISILITVLVVAGVISYPFFLYLALFIAVLFYFIELRKEFK